jgi:antitoxin MazE
MKSRVRKWGNSLAVRIPKGFAADAGLKNDAAVELSVVDGKLVVAPVAKGAADLRLLLTGINRHNLHREIDFGSPQGREVW